MSDPCYTCGERCWWEGCDNPADHRDNVELKRGNPPLPVYDGLVDLCEPHHNYAIFSRRMNIRWAAIEQALSEQLA